MRVLFNLVCSVSVILGLGATGAWVRSYYAADHLTFRRPFEQGGERVAAQARSQAGVVTFVYGTERVRPQDLPKLRSEAWTRPGLTHVERPLAIPPVAAMAEEGGASATRPAQTQPARASAVPAAPATPDLIEGLTKFDHRSDPRTGEVRVGRQKIAVATDRTVTVFPHWALAAMFFLLPALKLTFGRGRRSSRPRTGTLRARRTNSYDEWAAATPQERRRPIAATRVI